MKKQTLIILTILTIVLTSILSFYQVKPRKASDSDKQSPQFANTMRILQTITETAHPSSSVANYKVRDYLIKEIEAVGLKAEVVPFEYNLDERIAAIEESMAKDSGYAAYMTKFMKAKGYDNPQSYVRGKFGNATTDSVELHNILVKLDGSETNDAIMLVSHYDSVPTGPGTGDDGIAVASMLAYLQDAAKQNTAKNDVYFLFTDGEEQGLLGAYEYVENNNEKIKRNIKSVFNFEARGNQGGLFMFESSKDNYDLVQHFNKAVPQPIAFSVATTIYDNMPNDTDFSVFKRAKYDGLNFAMVEGFENYHASSDTVENLSKDTAWQYMQTVFGIGDYFSTLDLSVLHNKQKGLFFPFLGLTTIVLPEIVGYMLGFIPLLLALLIFYRNKTNGDIHIVGTAFRLGLGLATVGLTARALPASYIVSIPLTLFFLIDFIKVYCYSHKHMMWYIALTFLFAVFSLIVLTVPLMYMIQIALQKWYITIICVSLPVALIGFYLQKVLQVYRRETIVANVV